jgi:hypothetical protein
MAYNYETHYDPFHSSDLEEGSEYGYCGTYLYDGNVTGDKDLVSCKKCIKKFDIADKERQQAMEHNINDMGMFVEYMESIKE